jgi:hypothetical protein
MEGQPLDGVDFGIVATISPLVDIRLDERRTPSHMRTRRGDGQRDGGA